MSEHIPPSTLLGKPVSYPQAYSPSYLHAIKRQRPHHTPNFMGVDIWNAYELSWLAPSGKPQVGAISLHIPCQSPFLVESKSLKLYLNSFNHHVMPSSDHILACITQDLNTVLKTSVSVYYLDINQPLQYPPLSGTCIDQQEPEHIDSMPNPQILTIGTSQAHETLYSHLFRSVCPVTGQPDWATVWIQYQGHAINHARLLRYLIAYRQHAGFHEQCVEQIFADISQYCQPQSLSVQAYFTRRGGIDINPFRSNVLTSPNRPSTRTFRQ